MQITDEQDLHNAVLNAPIGICILDAGTLVAEIVNDKFLEVAGKPHHAISGQFYWDAFAEVRTYYEPALSGVVNTGQAYYADEVEMMLIRYGRQEKIFATFVYSPIKNKAGKVTKVAVWVLENTKQVAERQKQEAANAAFKKERDRLHRYFMQAPAGICILEGPRLVYELINPAYQRILPGRQLSGRPIFDALPELVNTPVQEMLLRTYNQGESCEMNNVLIPVSAYEGGPTKDRYFSFSFQPRRDENDVIDGIINIVFEVTAMINVQQDLRKAHEQADQQKRVYETITSGTPDLMYVWDLNYRFTYANSALLSMWGKTWDTAIGKGLRENGYEEWHAQMHEREIDQVKTTKQSIRGEVAFPHATLGKRIYDYILIPVLSEQGEVEAVAGTTRDVTERKQLEQALAQSTEELQAINEEMVAVNEEQAASNEELMAINEQLALVNQQLREARQKIEEGEVALRLAIDAANFGTWFIHSVTREFITDARLKELFGFYSYEELSIEQALAQIRDDYREFVAAKLEDAIYNNGDYDVTYPVTGLHDNRLRWLRAIGNLKADPSGTFSAFTGVVMDITEQYQATRQIEHAEENLRMALASGELATWHLDQKLGRITASPRFNEIFGFMPQEEIPYDAAVAQILPEYRQIVQDAVAASFNTGARFNVEYPISGFHDGKQRWVRSVGKFISDEKNGNFITGVMADITEQKTDELRKNDFIGMVSHELKTPLTSMKGYIQMLIKQHAGNPAAGILEKVNSQVGKMTAMINGFLNLSRLESGKIQIDLQEFDLAGLIKDTEEEFRVTSSSHILVFEPLDATPVNADRDKIGQVIHNLVGNAIKYSPAGSLIHVACHSVEGIVNLSVKDQGMGIRPDDLSRIFDRYYRVEGSHMFSISGFGIGLYLCSEIIQRHHGKLFAESEFGKGSTFTFGLPLFSKNHYL